LQALTQISRNLPITSLNRKLEASALYW